MVKARQKTQVTMVSVTRYTLLVLYLLCLTIAGTSTVVQDAGRGRPSVYSKSTEQLAGSNLFIPSACIQLLDLIGKGTCIVAPDDVHYY